MPLQNEDDSDKDPLSHSLVGEPSVQETTPFEPFNLEHLWRSTPTPEPRITREQTDTEESFQMTPELSVPTEWFFEALLEQRKPEPTTAIIRKPTKMNDNDNNDKRTTEIKGGKITPFAGKRETLERFLETIGFHLILNQVKDDEDKIAFTLTYLEEGDANSWRAAFLKQSITAGGEPNFGKWTDFLWELRNSFKLYDKEGDALDEIIWMRQGSTSIEDHVAKFKVLLADSGVKDISLGIVTKSIDMMGSNTSQLSGKRIWWNRHMLLTGTTINKNTQDFKQGRSGPLQKSWSPTTANPFLLSSIWYKRKFP